MEKRCYSPIQPQDASGQAALALVVGMIKALRDIEVFEHGELVMLFEDASLILPESAQARDIEARRSVTALFKEAVEE
jgi:hypothetical protein